MKQQDVLLEAMADIASRLDKLEAQMQGSAFHTSTSKYNGRVQGTEYQR